MIKEQELIMSKYKYIIYLVLRAFLIAVLCIVIFFFLLFFLYFGDLVVNVKSGHYKNPLFNGFVIVSPSMVPTIKVNDAIFVKRDNNDKYVVGDIISFFSKEYDSRGMIITHRVVDKKKQSDSTSEYTTKGDNNSVPDRQSVLTDNIYGKVLFIVPRLGYIQQFLSEPINFVCSIIIPALIIIIIDFTRVGVLFKKHEESSY